MADADTPLDFSGGDPSQLPEVSPDSSFIPEFENVPMNPGGGPSLIPSLIGQLKDVSPLTWAKTLGTLGVGGLSLAGLVQALGGGGQPASKTTSQTSPNSALLNFYMSQLAKLLPLQNKLYGQGAGLLGALASGNVSPFMDAIAPTIEQSFQPKLGSLYAQAVSQGQKQGFYDAPATSPPGGAILGPGLANLQGQEAQAKLAMLPWLTGALMNPGQQAMQTLGSSLYGGGSQTQSQTKAAPPSLLQTAGGAGSILDSLTKLWSEQKAPNITFTVGGLSGLGQ